MQYHMTKLRGSRVNEVLKMTQAISGGAAKYPKCQIPVHYKGLSLNLILTQWFLGGSIHGTV